MPRLLVFLFLFIALISCSKKEDESTIPPAVIPDIIYGTVYEFNVTPLDMTTPDKGFFSISADNTLYQVVFNATDQTQSNAILHFTSDSILTEASREFANLGRDAIAYNPVAANEIEILFKDGRKILGRFDANTSFGGVFGEQVIAQWRDPTDPAKPNQKAKDDLRNFVHRYADKDGPGADKTPVYLFVTVSRP